MMKLFYNLQRGVGLLVFCTILLSACVNHISEEEEDSVNNGDIPLKFIADIRESVGTRMANNNFAEGDEVGLLLLPEPLQCKKNVMWIIFISYVHPMVSLNLTSRYTIRMMELH